MDVIPYLAMRESRSRDEVVVTLSEVRVQRRSAAAAFGAAALCATGILLAERVQLYPVHLQLLADASGCRAYVPVQNAGKFSITWSGSCKDGVAEGHGKLLRFCAGELVSTYIGELVRGKAEGPGEEAFANGDRYEGEFYAGWRDGHGVYTFADGARYEGDFVHGLSSRTGVLRLPSGETFTTDLVVATDWLTVPDESSPSRRYPHADVFVVCFSDQETFKSLTPVRVSGMAGNDDDAARTIKIRAYTGQTLVSEPLPGCHMVAYAFGPGEYQVIWNPYP